MSASNTSPASAAFGFAEAHTVIQRAAFEAASRVIRYHATVNEAKLAQRAARAENASAGQGSASRLAQA